MLYTTVKWLVKLALTIYCRKIIFSNKTVLNEKGPLLLACNHPNSFFDAILLGAFFERPVHFLARGDAFRKPFVKKILEALHCIPIYRLSEGKEYLALNDYTFERCTQILQQGGIVLIFSEGLCENSWQLRPLKKGSARIALNTWKSSSQPNDFKILPVSFNYSTFNHFRKNVLIHFGKPVFYTDIPAGKNESERIVELNKIISLRLLQGLVTEEKPAAVVRFILSNNYFRVSNCNDLIKECRQIQARLFTNEQTLQKLSGTKKAALETSSVITNSLLLVLLLLPAAAGLVLHWPLYALVNRNIKAKTAGTVFYHSALFGALLLSYPLYFLVLFCLLWLLLKIRLMLLLPAALPLLAVLFLRWKDCFESIQNVMKISAAERFLLRNAMQTTT